MTFTEFTQHYTDERVARLSEREKCYLVGHVGHLVRSNDGSKIGSVPALLLLDFHSGTTETERSDFYG